MNLKSKQTLKIDTVTTLLENLFKNNVRPLNYTDKWSNNGVTFSIVETHRHIPSIVIDDIEYVLVTTAPEKIKQYSDVMPILCNAVQIQKWLGSGILPIKHRKNEDAANNRKRTLANKLRYR